MKKLIILFLASFIALSSLCALNVGVHLQTTEKNLAQENDQGYEAVLIGATTTLQKNLIGNFGIAGQIGIRFGAVANLDGELFSKKEPDVIDYIASASLTYTPLLGNNIYLYLDAHLAWSTMTWQTNNKLGWDRTTFHALSGGCSIGFLCPSRAKLQGSRFSILVSYDIPLLNARTSRQRISGETSSATGGKITATGASFSLSAGVSIPI